MTLPIGLIVSPAAQDDLERLRDFLKEKSFEAAQRASDGLLSAIASLQNFPDRGHPCAITPMRELIVPFGQSHYVLRYAHLMERQTIVILRIWHGREVIGTQK